jgi:hypothetical protein
MTDEQIQELLKPRYKLIADYPDCREPMGTIFTLSNELAYDKYHVWHYKPYDVVFGTWNRSFDKYPHLFQSLEWWQERPIESIPNYIRFGDIDKQHAIYYIKEWNRFDNLPEDETKSLIDSYGPCGYAYIPQPYFISLRFPNNYPSTLSDYTNYINQQINK